MCEAFYPSLQHLEIGLRNSIHRAATLAFRDALWFKRPFLDDRSKEDIEAAKDELHKHGKDFKDTGRMIAELKFGFWTRLFSRRYEGTLWNNGVFIKNAFPYADKGMRVRNNLAGRFDRIRQFRNRVFHYEPILRYNLAQHHTDITEAMSWIHPSLCETNAIIDRFSTVNNADYKKQIKEKAAAKLQSPPET